MKINGQTVLDATKKVKIHITAGDVKKGSTKDPGACAAALACMRELNATQARVHVGRTYLKINDKWVRYHTPAALRTEIVAFDRGGKFEPGEYTLSPMVPSLKLGQRRNPGPKLKKGKKPRARHVTVGIRSHGANR